MESPNHTKFYVVLDCGSIGTRLYDYQAYMNQEKDNNFPMLLRSLPEMQAQLITPKAKFRRIEPKPSGMYVPQYQRMPLTPTHRVANLSHIMSKPDAIGGNHRQLHYDNDRSLRNELYAGVMGPTYGGQSSFYGSMASEFCEAYGEPANMDWSVHVKEQRNYRRMGNEGQGIRIENLENDDAWTGMVRSGDGSGGGTEQEKSEEAARGEAKPSGSDHEET